MGDKEYERGRNSGEEKTVRKMCKRERGMWEEEDREWKMWQRRREVKLKICIRSMLEIERNKYMDIQKTKDLSPSLMSLYKLQEFWAPSTPK